MSQSLLTHSILSVRSKKKEKERKTWRVWDSLPSWRVKMIMADFQKGLVLSMQNIIKLGILLPKRG